MSEWNNEFTLNFLKLYRSEPILWDQKHVYHKDRKRISEAWFRLSAKLEIPVEELKKKKDSVMATFRGHLRKKTVKKASFKNGDGLDDDYRPVWFAYDTMLEFLGERNILAPNAIEPENPEVKQNTNHDVKAETSSTEEEEIAADPLFTPAARTRRTATRKTFRRRENPPELQEAGVHMKEAFSTLRSAINKRSIEEDECDLFARILAKKLRKLPEHERELFMYEIDGLFINRLRHPNHSQSNSYVSPTHTSNRHPSSHSDVLVVQISNQDSSLPVIIPEISHAL